MSTKSLHEEAVEQKSRGVLLVLTGPTGAGKDTVLDKLLQKDPTMIKIITTTSRAKREGESEKNPYYFVSREKFEQLIAEFAFFEWVEFRGDYKGTQKKTLEDALAKGVDVIWRIDTKGVKNIKEKVRAMTSRAVFVFISSPIEILKERVMKDEGEARFAERWHESLVKWEMEQYDDCDYLVMNEETQLETTVTNIQAIMQAKRLEIVKSNA